MWSVIITVVLQIVGFILERINASKETKQKFFEFVKEASNDVTSTKLAEWGEQQLKEIHEAKWD